MDAKKESFGKRMTNFFRGLSGSENEKNQVPQKEKKYSMQGESNYKEVTIPARNGDIIYIRNYSDTGKHFLYKDNQKYTVIQAEIYRHNPNSSDVFNFNRGTPISFEIPVGMTVEQVSQLPILQSLLDQPMAHPNNLQALKVNHIGKINMLTGRAEAPNPDVDRWVQNNLTTKLVAEYQARQAEYEAKQAEYEALRAEEMQVNMQAHDEELKREKEEIIRRSRTPEFSKLSNNLYTLHEPNELIAVKDGSILLLELLPNTRGNGYYDLIKHRDGSKEYVYSASLQRQYHEYDCHILSGGKLNVQFSLPCEIEQMYEMANDSKNPQNASKIAEMMEELITFPPPYKNRGVPYYRGGVKVKDGQFQWFDRSDIEKTIRLLGLDYENRGRTEGIDQQNNGKKPSPYDDGSR